MRIVFYGTPEFAVVSLEKIISEGFNVVAVVTSPDKPAGRGMKLQSSPVKQCAVQHGIPILQPKNLKDSEFKNELESFKPDLQVIIAFRMLPESIWNFPKLGTLNLHASLLPDYRGAAPINRAIMNGETKTGVTTFFLKHEIDTGDLLLQKEVEIGQEDDAGILHDRLMHIGAELVVETLQGIENNTLNPIPQVLNSFNKTAPKIFSKDCEINWNLSVDEVRNHIRGLAPYPGAYTHYQGKILKIFKASVILEKTEKSGLFEIENHTTLKISCKDGFILPEIVQPEGKRRMPIQDFLNGLRNS